MASAAAEILGDCLQAGVVLVKEGYAGFHPSQGGNRTSQPVELLEAGHPLPDERGVRGSARILKILKAAEPQDLVLGLFSGGGSAIMVSPAPGLGLADLQALTNTLLECGATVNEINTLRKHLEQLKGGQAARLAHPAPLAALILSDVVGDPLDVIASGPTVPDPSTYADAYQILKKYQILDGVPHAIRERLERGQLGELPETPKPGDPAFETVQNLIIGSNRLATEAALVQARREGFTPLLLTTFLQGEARQVGKVLASFARQIALDGNPLPRPACLVAGGETTVTLLNSGIMDSGRAGGRNQELALGAVSDLGGLPDIALVAMASDGGDGIAPPGQVAAAGAAITGDTLERARLAGLDPNSFLARNDAYHFFEPLGDLLLPGPTLTNVNDLALLFAF